MQFTSANVPITLMCTFISNLCNLHMVPSSYNCTHACDFLCGTTRFYSVSEVLIHVWFRPMATRGSQRGYKYDHV